MPAFRRFFTYTEPECFDTREGDPGSIRDAAQAPSPLDGPRLKKDGKKKSTLHDSLFNTNTSIFQSKVKTGSTGISSSRTEDEEIQLVERGLGVEMAGEVENAEDEQRKAEILYKEQHSKTVPRDW